MSFLSHPPLPPSCLSCGGIMRRKERKLVFLNMRPFVETSPHSFPPLPQLFSLFIISWHLLSFSFSSCSASSLPFFFVFPSSPFSHVFFYLSSESLKHPVPPLLFSLIHSIILAVNSRLISRQQIWIGPELRLCTASHPIERSVIMVIGHSVILVLVSLFYASFITLEKH